MRANWIVWAAAAMWCVAPGCKSELAPAMLGDGAVTAEAGDAPPEALEWPRDIETPEVVVTIYAPQLESFEGNQLTGRAAVAVKPRDDREPVFGAVWFSARVETDREAREVSLAELDVTSAKFPDAADQARAQRFGVWLEGAVEKWDLTFSLDRLLAEVDRMAEQRRSAKALKVTPPVIVHASTPTVLVSIDGPARMVKAGDTGLMRVVNTPFMLLLDPRTKRYLLKAGTRWMHARAVEGPWSETHGVPDGAKQLAAAMDGATDAIATEQAPRILVATTATELIVTEGEPELTPMLGTQLLFIANTESDVFMHIDSQAYFVLLSGRWFTSKELGSGWSHVAADALPGDFAKIPAASPQGRVRAHVAGTDEAREAITDAQLPQTAAIDRAAAKLTVTYDGRPEFKAIQGTTLFYAVNTESDVIKVSDESFFCCSQGVWFAAPKATGPWVIATEVPEAIYAIPASAPVYHVTYVHIYHYTPAVVYCGYTSGYLGCYVWGPTIVYGTGWHYHGWHGAHYYPRPVTWGVAVRYNPHTGHWGVGVGVRGPHGWLVVGGGGHGWYGPGGCHPHSIHARHRAHVANHQARRASHNLYNRRGNQSRLTAQSRTRLSSTRQTATAQRARSSQANRAGSRANNVYASEDGGVYRRGADGGWQKRTDGQWKNLGGATQRSTRAATNRRSGGSNTNRASTRPATRPATRPSGQTRDMSRYSQSRSRGTTRRTGYSNHRRTGGYSRSTYSRGSSRGGGGARRGGGGRRR